MKMIYTEKEQAWIDAKRAAFCNDKHNQRWYENPAQHFETFELPKLNTQIKEARRATAMGKTVKEMRKEVAHDNRHKSLLIKKERLIHKMAALEKELARVTVELENWG